MAVRLAVPSVGEKVVHSDEPMDEKSAAGMEFLKDAQRAVLMEMWLAASWDKKKAVEKGS